MVYKYECNAMRKCSSFLPHSSVQLSASAESRQQSVCVCRRAQLFFYLGAKERERKVTRLLTWPLIAGTNSIFAHPYDNFSLNMLYIIQVIGIGVGALYCHDSSVLYLELNI